MKGLSNIVDLVLNSFLTIHALTHIKFSNKVPKNLNQINGNADIIILLLVLVIQFAITQISKYGFIEIGASESNRDLKVWIRNTGFEIPNDFINMIFERQHLQFNKQSLELSIAKRIINIYGGKIWVESEIGKRNTFIFTIPNRD